MQFSSFRLIYTYGCNRASLQISPRFTFHSRQKVPKFSKAPHLKDTGSNPIKLALSRDRGTHYLGDVIVFISIEAIFMLFMIFLNVCLHIFLYILVVTNIFKNHK